MHSSETNSKDNRDIFKLTLKLFLLSRISGIFLMYLFKEAFKLATVMKSHFKLISVVLKPAL